MPKQVAKVVIENEKGEILLLLRGSTAPSRPLTWDLPGGIVDDDEDVESAAYRELEEETSIKGTKLQKVYTSNKPWGYVWNFYYGQHNNPVVVISWEHEDFMWVDLKELTRLPDLPDFYLTDIEKVYSFLKASGNL